MTELKTPDTHKEKKPVTPQDSTRTIPTKTQFLGNILVEDLRKEHVGKTVSIIGILKQYSKVLIRTVKARFECPSCGTIMSVIQRGDYLKEPSRCSCGRRGGFKQIDKDQVDFQILTVSDDPNNIEDARTVRKIEVFLKEALTVPHLEKTLKLNKRIQIIGNIVEAGGDANTSGLSIEAIHFNVGEQEQDRQFRDYLVDHYHVSRIQAQFLIILRNNNYNISNSVRKTGIGRQTHYDWLNADEDYAQAYKFMQEDKIDFIESEMVNLMRNGSERVKADMIKFYAKTQLGYSETQNIAHSGSINSMTTEECEAEALRLIGAEKIVEEVNDDGGETDGKEID